MTVTAINDTSTYKGASGQTEQALGVHIMNRAAESVVGPHTQIAFRSLGTTNPLVLSAGPCRLLSSSLAAYTQAAYLRFYDKATAPTAADTPVLCIALPAGAYYPEFQEYLGGRGIHFAVGCAIRITGAAGDTDTTVIAAGSVAGFFALVS